MIDENDLQFLLDEQLIDRQIFDENQFGEILAEQPTNFRSQSKRFGVGVQYGQMQNFVRFRGDRVQKVSVGSRSDGRIQIGRFISQNESDQPVLIESILCSRQTEREREKMHMPITRSPTSSALAKVK